MHAERPMQSVSDCVCCVLTGAPQELEAVPGGKEELDRLVAELEAREAAAKAAA